MANNFEVSFNSPQCGWMSIGFSNDVSEFSTTTAHAPHETALSELILILTKLAKHDSGTQFVLRWNRDPEEFDFCFERSGENLNIDIFQYPTDERVEVQRELVFTHCGPIREVLTAFSETFDQLYQDRETDEFEFNWRQPFPYQEFQQFRGAIEAV